MDRTTVVQFFLLLTICQSDGASMLGWLWGKSSDDTTVLVADGVPLISIPYESMTEDERFLQEAAKITDIQVSSPLETCQHKVVMKIRTSCSDMTEEQLAKLSVNLLNCQSAVEGRKMFPCNDEMSLKQCTTDMDPDMWNAYHLISNRARAVCYAARSTQFRALTELTVNKLMQTAHTQIKTLSSLKESQDRLEEQTVEALSTLSEGNKALLQQQQHLKDAQTSAYNLVSSNLRELSNERAMIRSGHAQLAMLAEDIKKKLEEASQSLVEQTEERASDHREVLSDLMNIQEQVQLIWEKIETSTNRIFEQHTETIDQYEETLQKLAQINDTIQFIWNVTNSMRAEVDEKLNWLTDYIGNTGEQMQKVYHTGLHVVYLLVAMIVSAFLQAPFLTRVTIMAIVPVNLASYMKHGTDACLDFTSMTALILLITAMHFLMAGIQYVFGPKKKNAWSQPILANQNGQNGIVASSPHPGQQPAQRVSLTTRMSNTARLLFAGIRYQINQFTQKCRSLVQAAVSWSRQGLIQTEELSCSYMPSRKSREDLVHQYGEEFPSMSEDMTDYETTNDVLSDDNNTYDYIDNLVDANDLRRRERFRANGLARRSISRQPTLSRSTTPSLGVPITCNGFTRTGRKCKLYATRGTEFCSKHAHGSSILGD